MAISVGDWVESVLRQAGIPFETIRKDDGFMITGSGKINQSSTESAEKSISKRYGNNGEFMDPLTSELSGAIQESICTIIDARYSDITDINQVIDAVAGVMLDAFIGFNFKPSEAKQMFSDVVDAVSN